MSAKVKFTIVIPSFNSERYIAEALNSVIAQNYENIELIVIDGGSHDGTLKVLEGYGDWIDILVSEADKGQSDAFNKGFNQASGDFFLWLNSDDLLVPGFLGLASNYLTSYPDCKWLTFNTIFIDSNSNIDFFHRGPSWSSFRAKNIGPQVDCPTSVFHKELFFKSDGFDLRLDFAMDIDLWYQFLKMGHRWYRMNQYGYAFRLHDDSKTGNEGYGAPASAAKISQAALIAEKHAIKSPSRLVEILVKFEKLLFKKPAAWLDTYRWQKKSFNELKL